MGVVDLLANVLEVAIVVAGVFVLACSALAALEILLELVERVVSRSPDPEETIEPPPPTLLRPRPPLTLVVCHDKGEGVLRASVQLRGGHEPRYGSIRLELTDQHERLRLLVCRPVAAEALIGELSFPAFAAPAGVSVEEALGWHWDLVLEVASEEPFRWREHPRPVEGMNAEAELGCPVP